MGWYARVAVLVEGILTGAFCTLDNRRFNILQYYNSRAQRKGSSVPCGCRSYIGPNRTLRSRFAYGGSASCIHEMSQLLSPARKEPSVKACPKRTTGAEVQEWFAFVHVPFAKLVRHVPRIELGKNRIHSLNSIHPSVYSSQSCFRVSY